MTPIRFAPLYVIRSTASRSVPYLTWDYTGTPGDLSGKVFRFVADAMTARKFNLVPDAQLVLEEARAEFPGTAFTVEVVGAETEEPKR